MFNEQFVNNSIKYLPVTDGIALDIGANHGGYTDMIAEKFKWVYAFEPHPDNVAVLQSNVKRNNITIIGSAISTDDKGTRLYTCRGNSGGHSISSEISKSGSWGHDSSTYIDVTTTTIDQFCKDKDVRFIKCDIEGAEDFIFNAASETLSKDKLEIILEVHNYVNYDRLYKLFASYGFLAFDSSGKVDRFDVDSHYFLTKIK